MSPPKRRDLLVRLSDTVMGMRWTLPTPLLLFAGVVALWPLTFVVRGDGTATPSRPTSASRLLVEAFVTAVADLAIKWLTPVGHKRGRSHTQ